MKNKEKRKKGQYNDLHEVMDILSASMMAGGGFLNILNQAMKDPRDADKYHLGNGLYLLTDKTIENNKSRYCHLVREDDSRVSDQYFRLGGMSHGFNKKPYCMLIVYPEYPKKDGWGFHCIIDKDGKIVLQADGQFDSGFYYHDGVIASKNGIYHNLLTGNEIVAGNTTVKSKQFYFVENNYNAKWKIGVWKINKDTGEYEIFE